MDLTAIQQGDLRWEMDDAGRRVAVLESRGGARYLVAGFLSLWLCGWLVGEVFALATALAMARPLFVPDLWPDLLRGMSPGGAGAGVALGFILFWLVFWTLGGLLAMRQVVHVLRGRERVAFDATGVQCRSPLAPGGRTRWIPRENIRRLWLAPRGGALIADTTRGRVTLATLGAREHRLALRDALRGALGLEPPGEGGPLELPRGWESNRAEDGTEVLTRDRRVLARQSGTCWAASALLALGACGFAAVHAAGEGGDPGPLVVAGIAGVFSVALAAGALFTGFFRSEWRVRSQALERRLGSRGSTLRFDAPLLRLESGSDSDGDPWFHLVVQGADRRAVIASSLHDPTVPLQLGRWLASRTGVRFTNDAESRAA